LKGRGSQARSLISTESLYLKVTFTHTDTLANSHTSADRSNTRADSGHQANLELVDNAIELLELLVDRCGGIPLSFSGRVILLVDGIFLKRLGHLEGWCCGELAVGCGKGKLGSLTCSGSEKCCTK
jgi:hypothetical protein